MKRPKVLTLALFGSLALTGSLSLLVADKGLSPLEVKGNRIVRSHDETPIMLKGAVSDFFRYNMAPPHDLQHELQLVSSLRSYGANIIGLYLADLTEIKKNIEKLDEYVDFAKKIGMYVYLMPVAREFSESYYPVWWSPQPKDANDLTELVSFLSYRYKDKRNVIYGFGAEPDIPMEEFGRWYKKQEDLAQIVRNNDPRAILVITGVSQYDLSPFMQRSFPFGNVIYQSGGYVSNDDDDYRRLAMDPKGIEGEYLKITSGYGLGQTNPILVGEFGGNVTKDFSSDIDLAAIDKLLEIIDGKKMNYTMYRLGARVEGDGLALFDLNGELTKKGKVLKEHLSK